MEEGAARSITLRDAGVTSIKVRWPASDDEAALAMVLSRRDFAIALSLMGGVLVVFFILILMVVPV